MKVGKTTTLRMLALTCLGFYIGLSMKKSIEEKSQTENQSSGSNHEGSSFPVISRKEMLQ